jgi:transcriptional regulator with PAS, ATPase and Fis domain
VRWVPEANRHAVCDLRSTNGTFLNGTRVDRGFLTGGDVIRVGNTLLVYSSCPPERATADEFFVGCAKVTRDAIASLQQVAPTDLKVLLTGETGTGKELAAQAIHAHSGRSGEFVPVNCGAFPATLIESELFGYVRGAFSGADRNKEGLFVSAHRGTLFLDEIGEFPLELQPRLLRVLQDQEVRPVGATHARRVDVRVVSATNRDIQAMVDGERFRRDLLARLNEWPVHLPPLRERREDIGLLVQHFMHQRDATALATDFHPDLLEHMLLAPWPANVRELSAAVARLSVVLGAKPGIDELLKHAFGNAPPRLPEARDVPPPPDADELALTLALYEGNISGVARYYGKERQQVYRWLDRFGLRE